jgi:chromosomal replication initiation ATPase DnaA
MGDISMTTLTPRERNLSDIGLVALRHGFTRYDILGPCKTRQLVKARQDCIAMFRDRGMSTPQIGRIMQRDHSTIVHALQKIAQRKQDGEPGASAGLI